MGDIPINKIKIRDSRFVLQDIRIDAIDDELIENSKNPVTSGAVEEAISDLQEVVDRQAEDWYEELERVHTELDTKIDTNTNNLQGQIDHIEGLIPERATSYNKLVDQDSFHAKLNNKVDKVPGKQLSTMDYTAAEKQKLAEIEAGAEVNIINEISANGTVIPVIDRKVDIVVPTELSDLNEDTEHRVVSDAEKQSWNAKQSALVFDDEPVENSNNPVKSSGIKAALVSEENARKAGLDGLNERIDTEIDNRDIAIATVVSAMEAAISAEADERSAADATKQDTISDLEDIRSGAALGATAIQEHQDISGKQDVISDLQIIREGAALGATAIQEHQDISGKADKADLATVATSGDYDDLDNKPNIPQFDLEDDILVINV